MYSHVMIGANDMAQSRAFYDATFSAIGVAQVPAGPDTAIYGEIGKDIFIFSKPRDGQAATHANGGTIGFTANSQAQVDAWHTDGLANGGTCEGKPGRRDWGEIKNYGAYLRDPTGNKLCVFTQNVDD